MHHGCSRAFRRTKDVILSREQGMQAGPMPVAVFVGYVMPQVSEFTGYGDGGVNIRRRSNNRISATCESRRSSHVGITANDWLERRDPIDVDILARLGLTAAARSSSFVDKYIYACEPAWRWVHRP
jgi:hypothetical protein